MSSILDSLAPADADRVRSGGTTLTLPQGWSPIAESTPADKAYLICEGEVSVRHGHDEVARLGAGNIVGEAGIMHHTLRSATIVALTPLKVVHFTSEQLEALAEEIPAFGAALEAAATERTGEAESH